MNNSTQKVDPQPSKARIQGEPDLLELLFKHTRDCVVVLDRNFNFIRVNEAYAKACKRKVEDFPGHNQFEFYPPDLRQIFEKVAQTRQPLETFARPFVFPDHPEWSTTYWDWKLVPALDDNGDVEFLIFTLRDVTERKQAQKDLSIQRDYLAKAQEMGKIGTWDLDIEQNKLLWTDQNYRIFGLPIGPDLTYEIFLNCVHPDDRDDVDRKWKAALEGAPYDIEHRLIVDGHVKWVREKAEVGFDENGNSVRGIGFTQDVTERKQAEEQLELKTRQTKILLDAMPCVALLLRPQTREIVAANKAAIKAGAVPGSQCYSTWGQRNGPCPWCLAPETWYTGKEQHQIVQADAIVWDAHWVPVTDDLYMHYAFDITARKRAEKELLRSERQLRSLASQLSLAEEQERQRLATELHDSIGQHLACLKIELDLLKRKSGHYPDMGGPLDQIIKTTKKVILETRSLTFEICPPFLHELGFEQTLEWFGERIQKKYGLAFEFADDGRSKPLGDDIRTLLFRTVRELLINVVKHAHANKAKTTTSRIDHCIQIIVEDDGVGFDILETCLNAENDNFSLGLFSIRERLRHLGGEVKIESSPGRGTRVTLLAPLEQEQSGYKKGNEHENHSGRRSHNCQERVGQADRG